MNTPPNKWFDVISSPFDLLPDRWIQKKMMDFQNFVGRIIG